MNIRKAVDKAFADKSLTEILAAPVSALNGVSEGDEKHLTEAFNIKTIKDLATNKHFLVAHGIAALAEYENSEAA